MSFLKKRLTILLIVIAITVISGSLLLASSNIDTNLVAHFNFDGDLSEQTGDFDDGQVIAERINNQGGSITYAEGIRGQAAVFDGQSGVLLPDDLITDDSYSVAIWLNPEEINAFTTSFFAGVLREDGFQSWISLVPEGPVGRTMLWSGNDPWYDAAGNLTIPTNQWTHLAFTVDQGNVKLYLNGVESFSGTGFPDVFTTLDDAVFALGVNFWDAPYKGMMDDLRIYDTAISSATIASLAEDAPELEEPEEIIVMTDPNSVSVHDPMIIEDDGIFYAFGSHLAAAKSDDLITWESISGDWSPFNPIIPNPEIELEEALTWPDPDAESTWAKSPIKLNNQYYLYFSAAHWESERSNISLAIADNVEGPYEYQGMLIRKYREGQYSEEAGEAFNHNIHPGVIDPHVFFDADDNLWMLYGSYAGGMHMLELDPQTGYPIAMDAEKGYLKEGSGYGKRIAGGYHAPMEGPFIQYLPETGYYYLLVSFGTLDANGGYNIRVARSENPDGPYLDTEGNDLRDYTSSNWADAVNYGSKLIGNFLFQESNLGYRSPGHNSAYYDEETGELYIVFHTRYPGHGELHQLRVHQMLVNSKGWPLITPHSYNGESVGENTEDDVIGNYQFVNHGRDIQTGVDNINLSENIELLPDGSISGAVQGSWQITGDYTLDIIIDDQVYHGVFIKQWDRGLEKEVMTFTALSNGGVSIWGSQIFN
ncbi:LamG-like jellyroll fold domain-containing protein [Natronospora cellulosivora (SeqCode)]